MRPFVRSSLSRQFLLISFPVLLTGMLVTGAVIAWQVQESVLHRKGAETGVYVNSFIAPLVQGLKQQGALSANDRLALMRLLDTSELGQTITAFNLWHTDGRILYSADPSMQGLALRVVKAGAEKLGGRGRMHGLSEALAGRVHAEITTAVHGRDEIPRPQLESTLAASRQHYVPRLVETYIPILGRGSAEVIAVAEFYEPVDELLHDSTKAQLRIWMVVAPTTAAMYLLLFLLVRQGSQTIERQQRELNEKVKQLTLHAQVRQAASTTTALNESVLRRISADLHDGPGQDLGYALMRFDSINDLCAKCREGPVGDGLSTALLPIHSAIKSALADLRLISAELRLPEIDRLSVNDIAARAVRDYESKTGIKVSLVAQADKTPVSLPVKIALYRLLQESLANGFRHAAGLGQRVEVGTEDGSVVAVISDRGRGFDPQAAARKGRLGLVGMRERVEILGGSFELHSKPGEGTMIKVRLPSDVPEVAYE